MPSEPLFSAPQLAAALGERHVAAARRRLGPPVGSFLNKRGKAVQGWTVAALPAPVRADLERHRVLHSFRSVEALLRGAPPLYAHPFTPDPAARADACHRRDVLAPLLARLPGSLLAPLAREAGERLAAFTRGRLAPAPATVERWMGTAMERDSGWRQYDHEELYYDLAPAAAPQPARAPQLGESVCGTVFLPESDTRLAWQCAFEQYERDLADGLRPRAARKAALALLSLPGGPLAALGDSPQGRDSKRKRFGYQLARWQREGRDFVALLPAYHADARTRRQWKPYKFQVSPQDARLLQRWYLEKDSFPLAVRWLAKDPACSPDLRAALLEEFDRVAPHEPRWPLALTRAGHVTEEVRAEFRSKKAARDLELSARRGMFLIDEEGQQQPMKPNAIWESDDMSSNEPFTWPEATPAGDVLPRIGRQTLCTLDVFSCHWLGVSPIGRERDAYRAEDIADHMRECVLAHGLPLIWRLERGAWENNFVDGVPLEGTEERWGGLGSLFHIVRAWKSKQKGTIESSFNYLQSLLAHESTSIGRKRGEFEHGTALMRRAQEGDLHAWRQFWPIGECADGFSRAMGDFNNKPKKRRAFGREPVSPADLYHRAEKRECPPDQLWRFLPVKRAATVRNGCIECLVKNYPFPFRFAVNGNAEGLHFEHGYHVLVAFHPGHPEKGCHVFNAERGRRAIDKVDFSQLMLVAEMAADAPQVDLSTRERAGRPQRQSNAALRMEFRAISGTGKPKTSLSTARNGHGDSATVERGERPRSAVERPDPGAALKAEARREYDEMQERKDLDRIAKLEAENRERGILEPL